ncbi:hypothetical protein K470DRAFT_70445 [Piedraia hortae CBS 480.64]|uniref:Uncharacterized protein n=1 Tax=Piedraia hortae CBS 480.64 TaxID=1314780 RepID=A0A6A7BZ49_9PEZI|nr:hypothetical protein K470DRAFT_70445 [Piedraia hortae CBS 480.64]
MLPRPAAFGCASRLTSATSCWRRFHIPLTVLQPVAWWGVMQCHKSCHISTNGVVPENKDHGRTLLDIANCIFEGQQTVRIASSSDPM